MPHKGRPYPFHPSYWSTEAWFWPGLAPWKLVAEQTDGSPPWFGCTPGDSFPISEAGVPSNDCKQIAYTFFPLSDCLVTKMIVTMTRDPGGGLLSAKWTCEAWYSDLHHDSRDAFQLFPQRVVLSPTMQLSVTVDECGEDVFITVQFRPATYEEGGSPYD